MEIGILKKYDIDLKGRYGAAKTTQRNISRAARDFFLRFLIFQNSNSCFRASREIFFDLKFQNPNFGFFLRARARSTRFSEKSKKNICGYHPPPGFFLYNTHTLTQCYAALHYIIQPVNRGEFICRWLKLEFDLSNLLSH